MAHPHGRPSGNDMTKRAARILLPLKVAYSALVALIVPFYVVHHGWLNFLWFSDIALLALVPGLWLEQRLLISSLAVATLFFEIGWWLDFGLLLTLGQAPLQIADYMADADSPLFLRSLSLFHLALPPLMLWALYRLGYDRRAWRYASIGVLILLPLTRLLTEPQANINWVYGPGGPQALLPGPLYLVLLMLVMPLLVFWPTHRLLARLFPPNGAQ